MLKFVNSKQLFYIKCFYIYIGLISEFGWIMFEKISLQLLKYTNNLKLKAPQIFKTDLVRSPAKDVLQKTKMLAGPKEAMLSDLLDDKYAFYKNHKVEIKAVEAYQNGYIGINTYLRDNSRSFNAEALVAIPKKIKALDRIYAANSKLATILLEETTVYRGVRDVDGKTFNFIKGKEFVDKGFVSTSKKILESFGGLNFDHSDLIQEKYLLKIILPKKSKVIDIEKIVQKMTNNEFYEYEREILLQRNAHFDVLDITKNNDHHIVTMKYKGSY